MYRFLVLTALLIVIFLFYSLTIFNYSDILPLDHSLAQIVVAPLVVLILLAFRIAEPRIPLFNVLALICGISLATFYRFQYPIGTRGGGILVAQLADDKIFNMTRIFREKINGFLQNSGVIAARSLHQSFSNQKEVASFLDQNNKIGMLVWGNQRWIQIAFRKEPIRTLRDYGVATDYYGIGNLSVVESVPVIGLSYDPLVGTARFISDLAYADNLDNLSESELIAESEAALQAAATQKSGWTSASHKAYPWWRLGNYYLSLAISGGQFKINYLKCAQRAYKNGLGDLRIGDNPELKGALFNNYGISIVLQALIERRAKLLYSAKAQFKNGYLTLFEKDPYKLDLESGKVSFSNFVYLLEAGRRKKVNRHLKRASKIKHKKDKLNKEVENKSGRKNSKRAIKKSSKRNKF